MNKRFFTLMAAVMLAGSPFASEAFASGTVTEATTSVKLQNGVKFIIKQGTSYVAESTVSNTNTGVTYATIDISTTTTTIDQAAVFEVTNVATNALGVTFGLKMNGKVVAQTVRGAAVISSTDADKIFTTFTTDAAPSYTLNAMNLKSVGLTSALSTVANARELVSKSLNYDADDLNEFNANSTTFSFGGTNLEGNVFQNVVPFTFGANDLAAGSAQGTYFVTGDKVNALKAATTQGEREAAFKKLNVVYVKNEKYGINTGVIGEGYKVVMISGADFYATSNAADFNNAAFQGINEADQLNKEGVIELTITPKLGTPTPASVGTVTIAAVKASSSDTKTYVTTVASGTRFASVTNPTLGANTYFAASEFLSKGEASAFNIYFPNGTASTDNDNTEYHKYLVNQTVTYRVAGTSPVEFTNLVTLAKNDVDLDTPFAQWIVSDFDERYTVTLTNRATGDDLELRLAATSNSGDYTIQSVKSGDEYMYVGDVTTSTTLSETPALAGKVIRLIPATLGKNDGFLNLSDDEMSANVRLSFTGADARLGNQTFYAADGGDVNGAGFSYLVGNTNASKAKTLSIAKYEVPATAGPVNDYLLVTDYAYLNANNEIVYEKDTLEVPAYILSYKYKATGAGETTEAVHYATSATNALVFNTTVKANADAYVISKALNGNYVMTPTKTATGIPVNAIGVNNAKQLRPLADQVVPVSEDFAYVTVHVNDNSDLTTLPAISRHATFENSLGAVSFQANKNGILEGILSAKPMTFWLDTADSEQNTPHFYISKGIATAEEETPATKADEAPAMRNFLVYAPDSLSIFDEGDAVESINTAYRLEGTTDLKAIFRPAALVAEDTLSAEIGGKVVTVVTKDAKAGQINALKNFQYGICLADADVEGEYIIYSKADPSKYLYSHNGKLGFGTRGQALVVTLGEGDATANEAIEAESGVQVIGGQGVVTVQGAAGKVITVANILGQTIANQVAASDNVTIAAPAGIVVVAVDGEATKVVVK